jgi:hypothetical protein
MTMATAWVSWRNWIAETGTTFTATNVRTDAPASNIADPRPDVRAIWALNQTAVDVECRVGLWDGDTPLEGVPVDVVGIIGTNFRNETPSQSTITFRLWDRIGAFIDVTLPERDYYGERDLLQTIAHVITPTSQSEADILADVVRVRLTMEGVLLLPWGTRDPYRRQNAWDAAADLPSIGTVWAGPVWRPSSGVGIQGYSETIVDPSDVQSALSGSYRAQVRRKLRVQSGRFVALSRDEYSAIPGGLAEMIAHAGTSRPVLIQPQADFGPIYGLLREPPVWEAADRSDARGIVGSAAYTVREIR